MFIAQYQIFKGEDGNWYWRLVGKNGEIAAQSQAYTRRSNAIRAAKRMPELAATTVIAEVVQ